MTHDKSGTAIDGLRPNYLRRSGENTVSEVIQKLRHFVARLFLLPPNDVSPRIGGVICRPTSARACGENLLLAVGFPQQRRQLQAKMDRGFRSRHVVD